MLSGLDFRARNCQGISRRSLLRAGVLGFTGLGLADLLRSRAVAGPSRVAGDEVSVILIWLDGGPPQHETYDPKPDAPAEFRGPLRSIESKVAGLRVSELLPKHAALLDKIALIRSMHHDNGDHFAAAHWMLTGYLGSNAVNLAPQYPSMASVITKLKGSCAAGVPAYVGLPTTHSVGIRPGYHGGAYLGVGHGPFMADGDPNAPGFAVPNLALPAGVDPTRFDDRRGLLSAFDGARREADASGLLDGLDQFSGQAYELVTGTAARDAFDLSREDPRLRDRYGRHQWGQSALMARRLVEAGVRFVTLTFGGWDYHSSLDAGMHRVLPVLDAAVASLIGDLEERGRLDSTIVLVMGEFGRTPRMNTTGVPGADPIPGRDHWGNVMSVLAAGGGFVGGQAIGVSSPKGEVPVERPIRPDDLAVTLYRRLGIDPEVSFPNHAGRPIAIGAQGRVITELLGG